jgi:hypothetical protein
VRGGFGTCVRYHCHHLGDKLGLHRVLLLPVAAKECCTAAYDGLSSKLPPLKLLIEHIYKHFAGGVGGELADHNSPLEVTAHVCQCTCHHCEHLVNVSRSRIRLGLDCMSEDIPAET